MTAMRILQRCAWGQRLESRFPLSALEGHDRTAGEVRMTAFIEATSPHVMNTYGRVPIALSVARCARGT